MLRFAALLALVLPAAATAAPLRIDVTALSPTTTLWTFSGSATASADGVFGQLTSTGVPKAPSQFGDVGDFTTVPLTTSPVLSGSALVQVGSGVGLSVGSVQNVLIDDDGGPDDVGFDFAGPTLSFATGDLVTFAGAVQVGLALSDLSAGGLPFSGTSAAGLGKALDLVFAVSEPAMAPVPLPAGGALLGGAIALLGWRRTRAA